VDVDVDVVVVVVVDLVFVFVFVFVLVLVLVFVLVVRRPRGGTGGVRLPCSACPARAWGRCARAPRCFIRLTGRTSAH
jgi:hypothetical protein